MTDIAAKTKRDYADLLARRASGNKRRLHRVPLCLEPELFSAREVVQEAYRKAVADEASRKALGSAGRVKMTDVNEVDLAKRALDEADQAVRDATIVLVIEGRTTSETVRVIQEVDTIEVAEDATDAEKVRAQADNALPLNRALILDAYRWSETVDGERIDEITPDAIASLIPTLSTGESEMLVMARNIASSKPDFPTLRRS